MIYHAQQSKVKVLFILNFFIYIITFRPENIRKAMNQSFNEIAENKRNLQKELLMNT